MAGTRGIESIRWMRECNQAEWVSDWAVLFCSVQGAIPARLLRERSGGVWRDQCQMGPNHSFQKGEAKGKDSEFVTCIFPWIFQLHALSTDGSLTMCCANDPSTLLYLKKQLEEGMCSISGWKILCNVTVWLPFRSLAASRNRPTH